MNFIRLPAIIVCFFAVCTVVGCAEGSTDKSGGSGGEGGDSWGGTVSSSSASSSSSSSSSGSSGATKCDTSSANCNACIACSRASADGLCNTEYNNCLDNMPCLAYATCVGNCPNGDAACKSTCEGSNPTGVPIYDVYVSCVICKDCYDNCDGTNTCQ